MSKYENPTVGLDNSKIPGKPMTSSLFFCDFFLNITCFCEKSRVQVIFEIFFSEEFKIQSKSGAFTR